MVKLTTTKARKDFSSVVDAAYARSKRIVLTRNGKNVAAVVPIADLEVLEAIEDKFDLEAVCSTISAELAPPSFPGRYPMSSMT